MEACFPASPEKCEGLDLLAYSSVERQGVEEGPLMGHQPSSLPLSLPCAWASHAQPLWALEFENLAIPPEILILWSFLKKGLMCFTKAMTVPRFQNSVGFFFLKKRFSCFKRLKAGTLNWLPSAHQQYALDIRHVLVCQAVALIPLSHPGEKSFTLCSLIK